MCKNENREELGQKNPRKGGLHIVLYDFFQIYHKKRHQPESSGPKRRRKKNTTKLSTTEQQADLSICYEDVEAIIINEVGTMPRWQGQFKPRV